MMSELVNKKVKTHCFGSGFVERLQYHPKTKEWVCVIVLDKVVDTIKVTLSQAYTRKILA